jgi:hypothetical protein
MLRHLLWISLGLSSLVACSSPSQPAKQSSDSLQNQAQSQGQDAAAVAASANPQADQQPKKTEMEVQGDFNGDGKTETARCQIYLPNGQKASREQVVEDLEVKPSYCQIEFSDAKIPALRVEVNGACMGLMFIGNEGDLNGDKADELSLVASWPTSNIRSIELYSLLQGSKWHKQGEGMINIAFVDDFQTIIRPGKSPKTALLQEYNAADPENEFVDKTLKLN